LSIVEKTKSTGQERLVGGWNARLEEINSMKAAKAVNDVRETFSASTINRLQGELAARISGLISKAGSTQTIGDCVDILGKLHGLYEKMTGGGRYPQQGLEQS
jgi:hypothetical protein